MASLKISTTISKYLQLLLIFMTTLQFFLISPIVSQKVQFDDHVYDTKAYVESQPPPPKVQDPYDPARFNEPLSARLDPTTHQGQGQLQTPVQYYSNGTHTLYAHGNVSEYYNPSVYGTSSPAASARQPQTPVKPQGAQSIQPFRSSTGVIGDVRQGSGQSMQQQQQGIASGSGPGTTTGQILPQNTATGSGRSIASDSTGTGRDANLPSNPYNVVEQTQRRSDQLARLEDVPNNPRYRGTGYVGPFSGNYVSNVVPPGQVDPSGPYVGSSYPGSRGVESDPLGKDRFPFGSEPVNIYQGRDRNRSGLVTGGVGVQPGGQLNNIGYYNPGGIYVDPRVQPGKKI